MNGGSCFAQKHDICFVYSNVTNRSENTMSEKVPVGIRGVGIYLPKTVMTAKEISEATGGN